MCQAKRGGAAMEWAWDWHMLARANAFSAARLFRIIQSKWI
jgi:hypothetical protein